MTIDRASELQMVLRDLGLSVSGGTTPDNHGPAKTVDDIYELRQRLEEMLLDSAKFVRILADYGRRIEALEGEQ